MLTILKHTDEGLQEMERLTAGAWVNVIDPTPEEIARLEEWEIPSEMITYPLDMDEMARTERDNGFLFILLRVSYFQGTGVDVPFTTIPLGIILTEKYIVTICKIDHPLIQEFVSGKVKGWATYKKNRFILNIFWVASNRYLTHLRQINKTVEGLEDQLEKSTRNSEVLGLLKYQKSLTYFATALRSNEVMMERLQRMQVFTQYDEDQELLEDVITENQQAIQMVNIATDILAGLMDAFASIISNNLNTVMKALAALTIIVNLPAVVAAFYGMNVRLPGETHPLAFLFVFGISLSLTAVAVFVFYKRDWF